MMVEKSTYILLTLGLFCIACNAEVDLDALIKDVFKGPDQTGTPATKPTTPTVINPTPPVPTKEVPPETDNRNNAACGPNEECVPRHLCNDGKILTDGTGIIDIRINLENDPKYCKYLQKCCSLSDKTSESVITVKPQPVGCGYRNLNGVGYRITNSRDSESEFGEFPWMVAILREEKAGTEILNLYECGGALIAPTVVITAAHCVQNRVANTLIVRAGEWDTRTTDEILNHEDQKVQEIISHEGYYKGGLFNDIAILILEAPLTLQENIRPICLPQPNANFDNSRCFATGWGKDKFNREGQYQVIMKKIDLPIVPRDTCQRNLRTTRLGKFFQLHDSFICAGGEKDKDTCKGDGGSPLVCPIPGYPNRYYHAGIVAWGIGCGEENIPGVYASVSHLRNWLNEKLLARNIDFSFFTA